MRRYLYPFILLLTATPTHAQNPDEVRRLCSEVVQGDKYLDKFLTCEPSYKTEQGRKEFIDAPWDRKIGALLACHQNQVRILVEREVDSFKLCLEYR